MTEYEEAWKEAEEAGFVDEMARNLEVMAESALVMSIANGNIDVKFACEIGYAIWLDKPIVVVNVQGQPLPEKLRMVATRIVDVDWSTQEGRDEAAERVGQVITELREEGII